MKKEKNLNKFDLNYLNQIIFDKSSSVVVQTCKHHLALHPFHLKNLHESVKDILGKGIIKYDANLNGILFGYQNIKLLSSEGTIVNEASFIHIDIEADFFVFRPNVGSVLTGTVSKKSKDHIGCLVHKLFNVSIPKLKPQKKWTGDDLELGDEIKVEVISTNFYRRIPYIRGKIISVISKSSQIIPSGTKIRFASDDEEELVKKEDSQDFEQSRIDYETQIKEKTKKKKAKSKAKTEIVKEEQSLEENTKKKKKKKRKDSASGETKSNKKLKTEAENSNDNISLPDLDLNKLLTESSSDVDPDDAFQKSFSRKRVKSEIELPLSHI